MMNLLPRGITVFCARAKDYTIFVSQDKISRSFSPAERHVVAAQTAQFTRMLIPEEQTRIFLMFYCVLVVYRILRVW